MVSWDKMCRPKNLGGLRFRKAEATNKAFLAKMAWGIISEENNLWIKVVKSKYLAKDGFMTRKTKNTNSWAWKKISKARELLRRGIRWKLGNRKKIYLWTDFWYGNEHLLNQTNKTQNEVEIDLKVSDIITDNKTWDLDNLQRLVGRRHIEKISMTLIPINDIENEKC